jgi:hypothetical protein
VATPTIHGEVMRVEVGYFGATLVLSGLLWAVYRRGPAPASATAPATKSVAAGP